MIIRAKVFTNSRKPEIIQKINQNFEIKVKAKPEDGKANAEAIAVLSKFFDVQESDIKLLRGSRIRNKIFKISQSR